MLQTLSCYALSFTVALTFWICIPACMQWIVAIILSVGSTIFLCVVSARILDRVLPRRRVSPLNKAVFITGCDSGFGHLLATRLDSRGYKVFAGCLIPNGSDAEKLRKTTSSNLTIVGVDVTNDQSVQNALKTVQDGLNDAKLWAVVNNAGIIARGELEWISLECYKKLFEVNTFGVVRVTQAFLPLLRKFKGRMVTTSSFAGRFTFTTQVPYCMTKHATTSFCDGLRREMEKWDVKVVTVEPFAFRSPMTEMKGVIESVENAWSKAPAEIKEPYGTEYIDEFTKTVVKFNELATSSKTSKVIDCLEEAVTAVSPQYSYTPGDMKSVVGFWFIRRLSVRMANFIITRFITFDADIAKSMKNRIQKMRKN